MKKGNLWTLLKSTRVERAFYIVSMILIPAAFANTINLDLLVLSICCVLLYSISGIHNSKRDKDHILPSYYKKFIVFLVLTALVLSLYNILILITVILSIFLGAFYNTISRKILFGDATVLGFTHAVIPIIASSLIVGLDLFSGAKIAVVFYVFIWVLGNARNQKDSKGDKKRKYVTYATLIENPRVLTKLFFNISFFIMLLVPLIFKVSMKYFVVLSFTFIIEVIILYLTDLKKDALAMQLARFTIILFSFALVFDKTTNLSIILSEVVLGLVFLLLIFQDLRKGFKIHKLVK